MSFQATPVLELNDNQAARRARVLDAVLELVAEGRVDDVQMKEVADRSGVALGTIYRYFASKDHLFAAALVEWVRGFAERTPRPPASPAAPADSERLMTVLRRGMRPFQERPGFARLMHVVSNATDPHAGACALEIAAMVGGALSGALPGLDPARRERVVRVVLAVWNQSFVDWVLGRISAREMHRRLEDACDLLLS